MVRDKVVVGSGMIGSAFSERRGFRNCVIYAAGTANSSCVRQSEFDRDVARLKESLLLPGLFIYISTCSVEDKPYTHHKRRMEDIVREHGNHLILRLPIVAGSSHNPHTLLNFLASCVERSEEFDLYVRARRNVIDVADVVSIADWLVRDCALNETVNVAAPMDYSINEIVSEFEQIYGKPAFFVEYDRGDSQVIDTRRIADSGVDFSGEYLVRTLRRYYK